MEQREYAGMAERETTYFWHVGRREILREALDRHSAKQGGEILDIGCGTGGNMLLLGGRGAVTGIDFSSEALKFAAAQPFKNLMQADATRLPLPGNSFDLAVSLDVLEHIPDDAAAMREAYRVLRPGSIFLVTVPAYQWLWSQHDMALHHVRRYTRLGITGKLRAAGFHIMQSSHFVMLGVPMNLTRKILDRLQGAPREAHVYDVMFPRPINAALLGVLRLEKFALRALRLPWGTSILVVAKKPLA